MIIDLQDSISMAAAQLFCKSLDFDERIGFIAGSWDLFHSLHLSTLRRAGRLCKLLIVGVATDHFSSSIRSKSFRPFIPEERRLDLINNLGVVDICLLINSFEDEAEAVELLLKPTRDVVFKNDDWVNRLKSVPGYNHVQGRVIIIPDTRHKYYGTTGEVALGIKRILENEDDEKG